MDLFGNEKLVVETGLRKPKNLFTDYDSFTKKFEPKKTTDDCYTPPEIYQLVLDYVASKMDLQDTTIVRPFYPGLDYQSIGYPPNCIVIDNPPFSIITQIAKFYIQHKIRFFLFAPHLTLFSSDIDCTHLVVGANIKYENGAQVKTSFLSNVFGNLKVIGDSELYQKFEDIRKAGLVKLPKYVYPNSVLTVSAVQWLVEKGISIQIEKQHAKHWRGLDSQKKHNKAIFGSGFLISDKAAADKAAADKAAADKAAADKAAADKENVIVWGLSAKELAIIKDLG